MANESISEDSNVFSRTDREKRSNKINTIVDFKVKSLTAIMGAIGFTKLTGASCLKETSVLFNKLSGSVGDINITRGLTDKAINGLLTRANAGEPEYIEIVGRLYDTYGEFAINHPVMHSASVTAGVLVSGALAYKTVGIAASKTLNDFEKIYEGGYEQQTRNKFFHQGDLHSQKYTIKALSRSFQNNLINFSETLTDGVNNILSTLTRYEKKESSQVFFKMEHTSPKLAGLLKALYDLKLDTSHHFDKIKEDPAFANKTLTLLLKDTNNLLKYFEMNKVGIHEFNQAVKGSLGKDAGILLKNAHDVDQAQPQWHALRTDVLTKTFRKISLYNIQSKLNDAVTNFMVSQHNKDTMEMKKALLEMSKIHKEFKVLSPILDRPENSALKKSLEQSKDILLKIIRPFKTSNAKPSEKKAVLGQCLTEAGLDENSALSEGNIDKIRQAVSSILYSENAVERKSFKSHYYETMFSEIESKLSAHFSSNDFKVADLKKLSVADLSTLCKEHGTSVVQDIELLADNASKMHVLKIKEKVFANFSNKELKNNASDFEI
jgi:hypothetical protein